MVEFTVTEDDINQTLRETPHEQRLQNLHALSKHIGFDSQPVVIEKETSTSVIFGIPAFLDKSGVATGIAVSKSPHVFLASELYASDPHHVTPVKLEDVPVMLAHGYRDDKDVWRFEDGQNVVKTVKAYNSYALKSGLPVLEFVMACNRDDTPNPAQIKLKDLETTNLAVQAVGESMTFGLGKDNRLSTDGHIIARVNTRGEFLGLDELEKHKNLVRQIKIS